MTDLAMWELIVGFISATFLLPIVQRPTWTEKRRSLVTFGYCIIVGLGTAFLTGAFEGANDLSTAVSAVLFMLVSAVSMYKGFAKPTGIAPAIEDATSPDPAR